MNRSNAGWKYSIDFRMLSILLLIAVVPILLGTCWFITSYEQTYLEAQGKSLAEAAEMGSTYLNTYLGNRIIEIAGLTEVPVLREIIEKGNQDLQKDLKQVRQGIISTEARWGGLDYSAPELRAVLDNPASDFLQRYAAIRTSYREIIVTDFLGRTVAATGKTSNYHHANDVWWKEAYADGQKGAVYIGTVHYHESAKIYSFDIAQPFVDPNGGVIGIMMVGIDAQDINALLGSLRSSFDSTAALLQTDGRVISALGYGTLDKRTFPDADAIIDAQQKGKRYIIGQSEPRNIYGLASRNFLDTYPHLKWVLTISNPVQTVISPLSSLWRNVLGLVLAVVVINFLITLWLSRGESKPIIEEDAHLEKL